MNRWLYRAAGTVGIAGGFLLLGAGSAQADEAEDTEALLGDVFSPTSGLPRLDLPVGGVAAGTPDPGTLTLDPHDGRLGQLDQPELLPGLPALPTDALNPLLDRLPLDGIPLDAAGVPGGVIGTGGELADDGLLRGDLVQLDSELVGSPTARPDTGFRTLPAPAPIPPAQAATAGDSGIVGSMPLLADPVKDTLPGEALSGLSMIRALTGQVPVAGPVVGQHLRSLPLVDELAATPTERQRPPLESDPLTGPLTGAELSPVIAHKLAAERGHSPELIGNGLPLLGDGLDPIGRLVSIGNLPQQLPLVGPVAGPTLGTLPAIGDSGPAPAPAATAPAQPGVAAGPAGVAGGRPIAGEDPEYAGAEGFTGSPEVLSGLPALPLDPLAVVRSLPLVGPVAAGVAG